VPLVGWVGVVSGVASKGAFQQRHENFTRFASEKLTSERLINYAFSFNYDNFTSSIINKLDGGNLRGSSLEKLEHEIKSSGVQQFANCSRSNLR
jgi:hypothetical protein